MADISRLVLTRKTGQSINIGGLVAVAVEEIRGRAVRLSVEAPRGIAVHREEIYRRMLDDAPGESEGLASWPAGAGGSRPEDVGRLVLTRKAHQGVIIAGVVGLIVEEIRGRAVRLSVRAPRGLAVHRREIYERILDDGAAGACVPAGPRRPAGGPRVPEGVAAAAARPPGGAWDEPL